MGQELKDGIMKSVRLAIGSMQKFAQSHWSQAAVSSVDACVIVQRAVLTTLFLHLAATVLSEQ